MRVQKLHCYEEFGSGQGRGRAIFSYACISRPLSSSSATNPFHKEKENVRSSTLHCNAIQKLHCSEKFKKNWFYSVFCFECRWKSFKVNCLQTYFIILWEPEQHNVSAYFTSKVYENGVYLIILKTFTNFWMLEENKVVQRSHFKQAFSPSSMEDLGISISSSSSLLLLLRGFLTRSLRNKLL